MDQDGRLVFGPEVHLANHDNTLSHIICQEYEDRTGLAEVAVTNRLSNYYRIGVRWYYSISALARASAMSTQSNVPSINPTQRHTPWHPWNEHTMDATCHGTHQNATCRGTHQNGTCRGTHQNATCQMTHQNASCGGTPHNATCNGTHQYATCRGTHQTGTCYRTHQNATCLGTHEKVTWTWPWSWLSQHTILCPKTVPKHSFLIILSFFSLILSSSSVDRLSGSVERANPWYPPALHHRTTRAFCGSRLRNG